MKLLVLDGNSIINRAFYGIRLLSNKEGVFTNAIYGFLNILEKLREQVRPDAVVAAFDLKAPTFRHEMYDEYKAGRKKMPDELAGQLPVLKRILTLAGVTVIEKEGFEADDILGTLSLGAEKRGWECFISTGDRDSLQLVGEKTTVLLAATKAGQPELRVYDEQRIKEEYGLTPLRLIDLKALMGDSSDNIPGVAGVGPKTASELIVKFGSLDGVYENIDSPEIRDTLRAKLVKDKENAYLSRRLGEICRTAPVDDDPQSYAGKKADEARLAGVLSRLELFRIIDRMGLKDVTPVFDEGATVPVGGSALPAAENEGNPPQTVRTELLTEPDELFGDDLKDEPIFLSHSENTGAFAVALGGKIYLCGDKSRIFSLIKQSSRFVAGYDMKGLYRAGMSFSENDFDVQLGAYLLNPSASGYELGRLAKEYAAAFPVLSDEQRAQLDSALQSGADCAQDALIIQALYKKFTVLLAENSQSELMKSIEMPLCAVLADMESIGFAVEKQGLEEFGERLQVSILDLQTKIYELVGYEFNLNSPKQLSKALFEDLGLKAKKKTKSGFSTSAEVLEELKFEHPAVSLLLDYRQLSKLKSTYVDGMVGFIDSTGRIHSTFNQTETRTGRISSLEPNLQNIPVRKEAGRELRRFFIAKEGCVLCDADYSQIELRVLSHMADDQSMINAFLSGEDIHTATASQVFSMPKEAVTPLMRSRAKAVNFGIVYGIGAYSLSRDLGISFAEAKNYINGYMNTFSGVAKYMEEVVEKAKADGFVTTYFGRRRYLPELSSKNAAMRSFGERVARNMPVQGTAADIIKIAMINVHRALKENNMRSRLILQVHDELIVEAPEDEKEKASQILKDEMENAVRLKVPMTAEVATGKTWFDAKK